LVPIQFLAPIDCSKTPALKKVIEKKEEAKPLGKGEKKVGYRETEEQKRLPKDKDEKMPLKALSPKMVICVQASNKKRYFLHGC
jgi:hypothetical protein